MKLVMGLAFALVAGSSFASSVSDKVASIEASHNVKCEYTKSSFAFCIGTPREMAVCRYSETYYCYGAESFKLKLKVKSYFDHSTNRRETKVTKTQIL